MRCLIWIAIIAIAAPFASAQVTVYSLDFEAGAGVGYTVNNPEFDDVIDANDYWARTDGSGISVDDGVDGAYNNVQGTFFFASEDHNADGGATPATLTTNSFSLNGASQISFSGFLPREQAVLPP